MTTTHLARGDESGSPLLGDSTAMRELRSVIHRVALHDATVLLRGATGTGKSLVARVLHEQSGRRGGPFVAINCGACAPGVLESELFGHERGAFTGAVARHVGHVERAEGGTLFLDEIGDMTPAMQVRLLRLLQEQEYLRVGGAEALRANVRVIAATHRDLEAMMAAGTFRRDLYYRLDVVPIHVPGLESRPEDVEGLARHFFERSKRKNGRPRLTLTRAAVERLRLLPWPGQVRQLENFVERLVLMAPNEAVSPADVEDARMEHASTPPPRIASTQEGDAAGTHAPVLEPVPRRPAGHVPTLDEAVRHAEVGAIAAALEAAHGNRVRASRLLGISRATLHNKLRALDLERATSARFPTSAPSALQRHPWCH